jgi:hypothetical protein
VQSTDWHEKRLCPHQCFIGKWANRENAQSGGIATAIDNALGRNDLRVWVPQRQREATNCTRFVMLMVARDALNVCAWHKTVRFHERKFLYNEWVMCFDSVKKI